MSSFVDLLLLVLLLCIAAIVDCKHVLDLASITDVDYVIAS